MKLQADMASRLMQNEDLRIDTLDSFGVLDAAPDEALEAITQLAAQVCNVSAACIAFVGHDRAWLKACVGLDAEQVSRKHSPFDETILGENLYEVPDANMVALYGRKGILLGRTRYRFFAAAPLIAPNGAAIGCLAVLSEQPYRLTERDVAALNTLAHQILTRLELNARIRLMENESRVRHRVESALTVERNFVSAVLDTAGALVVVLDTAGRVVRFNRACEAISGYQTNDIVGHSLWESLVLESDCEAETATFHRIRNGEFPVAYESRWRIRGGEPRRIQWMATALLDERNEVSFVIATGIDVTLQREAEETLRESEARYRRLIEGSQGMVFTHDMHGSLLSLNPYTAESLGYSVREMIGAPFARFLPTADRPLLHEYLQAIQINGEAQGTFRMLSHNGEERFIGYRARMIRVETRDPYALLFGVDITEQIQAEEQLSALMQQSNSILDSVGDGIIGIDLKGQVTLANPAAIEMLGYKQEEILGKSVHTLVHHTRVDGTMYPEEECPILKTVERRETIRVSTEVFWGKDGNSFPVEYVACPILQNEQPTGVVIAFSDTTERRALERMKDEFISTVSHELRTPLTSMRASLGLIASGALATRPEKQTQMLEIAIGNTDRLVNLVNDILELERIGSGKAALQCTMCSADDLMRRAAGLLAGTASKAGIDFRFDADHVAVWADPDRMMQTLTNLLSNSIKFSPRGSIITLKARNIDASRARLEVHDEGRGIPSDKLESIFERFHQVDASDSRTMGGTGLGLAICRSIIAQHNGKIWAESELGKGASFYFTLPTQPVQHLS